MFLVKKHLDKKSTLTRRDMIVDAKVIGIRISELRKSRNMTQQQLADELFVTNKTVSKWETGRGLPDIEILPVLASVLGVNVEDIIFNAECPDKKNFHTGAGKAKTRKISIKRIAIIIAAALLLAFGIYNIVWFNYISIAFTPFVENGSWTIEALRTQGMIDSQDSENRTWVVYLHRDDDERYEIQVIRPSYLRFGGAIKVMTIVEPVPGEIFSELKVTYTGKTDRIHPVYTLSLHEWSTGFRPALNSTVDRYGQPLDRDFNISVEYYEKWLSLYERNYSEIMEMITYFNDFFGKDDFGVDLVSTLNR